MLLMATPYADTAHAYNVVLTAASANDSSTPDQPLGHGHARCNGPVAAPQSRCSAGNPTEERCNETNCRTHRPSRSRIATPTERQT